MSGSATLLPSSAVEELKSQEQSSAFSGQKGRNAVLFSIGAKIAVVLLNAATGILTARLLLPSGRGELAALLLWPLVLSGTITLGLPSSLTFFLRSCPSRSTVYKSSAVLVGLSVGLLVSIAAVSAAPLLLQQYSPETVRVAQWLMPNTIIALLLLIGRGAIEATGDFRQSSLLLVIPPGLTLASLSLLGALGVLNPERAAITYIVSGLPAFACLWRQLAVQLRMSFQIFSNAARELLSYGFRSYGMDLCGTLAIYIDQALVITLLSPSQMGVYVVALSVSRMMNVLPQALSAVLFPKLVGASPATVLETIGIALRLVAFISAGCFFLLLVGGPMAVRLLYGAHYGQLVRILYILICEAALSGLVTLASQAFMALNRPGVVTLQQIAGLLFAIPFLLVLIPRFGVMGAAVGILLSTAVRSLMIVGSFPVVLHLRIPDLLIKRSDAAWLLRQVFARNLQRGLLATRVHQQ